MTIMTGYDDGYARTAPVGSYEANPWGLHDVIGNVAEWTADWYDGTYYANSPDRNPKGASSGQFRVLRGGSWSMVPRTCDLRPGAGICRRSGTTISGSAVPRTSDESLYPLALLPFLLIG